jgi:molybdopterin converting factor small subunit
MRILFYGPLAEIIAPEVEFDLPGRWSIAEVRRRLAFEHPGAADALASKRVRACVAGSLVQDDYVVTTDHSIEFLSPVSGG